MSWNLEQNIKRGRENTGSDPCKSGQINVDDWKKKFFILTSKNSTEPLIHSDE